MGRRENQTSSRCREKSLEPGLNGDDSSGIGARSGCRKGRRPSNCSPSQKLCRTSWALCNCCGSRLGPGCFKNVSIAFKEEKFQKPTLFCKVCNRPQSMPASAFSWTVNGVPVKDGQRTKPGARIAVDPFSKEAQGRWTCTSAENPEWQAEYCLELAASDYTPPVDLEADDDAGRDASLKLFYLAFVVAGAVLTLTLGAILFACCFDRKSSEREKEQAPEEELENMAGAQLPSAALPTPERHPSGQRSHPPEIRDTPKKTSDSLLYAQLDHFPIKQNAKHPSPGDRATIYATIV